MSATPAPTGTQAEPVTPPPAGTPAATPAPSTTETPPAGRSTEVESISLDEAKKLRSEAKSLRDRLRKFEEAEEAKKTAEMTELEKIQARLAELEPQLSAAQQRDRDYALRDALAEQLGTRDFPHTLAPGVTPAKLLKVLDPAKVEWAESGQPANAKALLSGLAKSDPYLFARPRVPSADGGAGLGQGGAAPGMNQLIRAAAGRGQ